jgi:hypothetical protein
MDQYLAEIEVIEWFRMARTRSERATMLAGARTEEEAESAKRTHSTSLKTQSDLLKVASKPLRRYLLRARRFSAEHDPVSGSSRT